MPGGVAGVPPIMEAPYADLPNFNHQSPPVTGLFFEVVV